jgi:hypothetical protein
MPLDTLSTPSNGPRLAPVAHRHAPLFCLALLTVCCVLASFALACATPFAAFAVVAAAMLPIRTAAIVVACAWLVNQAIGFGALHYPIDGTTALWGLTIGISALVSTLIAAAALRILPRHGTPLALALALLCAYGAYEVTLLAATAFLGGAGGFTTAIIARLGFLNFAWLMALVAACEIVRLLNPLRRRQVVS